VVSRTEGDRVKEVTIREAAALLGVHEYTIRNWINAGTLPALYLSDVEVLAERLGRAGSIRAAEPLGELAVHRLQVSGNAVTVVRERVERKLGVETTARPEGDVWAIYFNAPKGVDVDFLRPDVLPPKEVAHV
jgi:hypothetical protein